MMKVLTSRTFWTVTAMFVIGGVNAILPMIPAGAQTFVMAILAIMAWYFHINPSQTYNLPTDGSSIRNPVDVSSQVG